MGLLGVGACVLMVVVAAPATDVEAVFTESYTVELGSSLILGVLYLFSLLLAGQRWLPLVIDRSGLAVGRERLVAVTAGDDYQLLFALPAGVAPPVAATWVGAFAAGAGLSLTDGGESLPLPGRLGWEHDGGAALVD